MKDGKSHRSSPDPEAAAHIQAPPPYTAWVELHTVSGSSGAAEAGQNSHSQVHYTQYQPTSPMSSKETIVDSETADVLDGTRADAPGHVSSERPQCCTRENMKRCGVGSVCVGLAVAFGAGFASSSRHTDGDTSASTNATDTVVSDNTTANVTTMALAPTSTDVAGPMTTVTQAQSTDGTSAYTTGTADPTRVSGSARQRHH